MKRQLCECCKAKAMGVLGGSFAVELTNALGPVATLMGAWVDQGAAGGTGIACRGTEDDRTIA